MNIKLLFIYLLYTRDIRTDECMTTKLLFGGTNT